jgi:hypothetical protein
VRFNDRKLTCPAAFGRQVYSHSGPSLGFVVRSLDPFESLEICPVRASRRVIWAAILVSPAALAHHSYHMYDLQHTAMLEGRVISFDYVYPHAFIELEVSAEDGTTIIWDIETVSPGRLQRCGVASNSLAAGERVRIAANPPRNVQRRIAAGSVVTKADGSELVIGFQGCDPPEPESTAAATSLGGLWLAEESYAQVSFPDILGEWPLTQPGRDALDRFDGSQTPAVNCVPYSPPITMLAPEPMVININEVTVTILPQSYDSERLIYVDGRPHPDDLGLSIQGHSIGHWDDGVLIVDTVLFAEHESGNALGIPSGTGKHLTERFALSEDGTTLNYSFTVEDPQFLTAPVSGSSQWTYRPDLEFELSVCDPESARRFLDAF